MTATITVNQNLNKFSGDVYTLWVLDFTGFSEAFMDDWDGIWRMQVGTCVNVCFPTSFRDHRAIKPVGRPVGGRRRINQSAKDKWLLKKPHVLYIARPTTKRLEKEAGGRAWGSVCASDCVCAVTVNAYVAAIKTKKGSFSSHCGDVLRKPSVSVF